MKRLLEEVEEIELLQIKEPLHFTRNTGGGGESKIMARNSKKLGKYLGGNLILSRGSGGTTTGKKKKEKQLGGEVAHVCQSLLHTKGFSMEG